jgi:hypothetical protein
MWVLVSSVIKSRFFGAFEGKGGFSSTRTYIKDQWVLPAKALKGQAKDFFWASSNSRGASATM